MLRQGAAQGVLKQIRDRAVARLRVACNLAGRRQTASDVGASCVDRGMVQGREMEVDVPAGIALECSPATPRTLASQAPLRLPRNSVKRCCPRLMRLLKERSWRLLPVLQSAVRRGVRLTANCHAGHRLEDCQLSCCNDRCLRLNGSRCHKGCCVTPLLLEHGHARLMHAWNVGGAARMQRQDGRSDHDPRALSTLRCVWHHASFASATCSCFPNTALVRKSSLSLTCWWWTPRGPTKNCDALHSC